MRFRVMAVLLSAVLISLAAQDRQSAMEFNDIGFELYEEGRYTEALAKFEASWRADESYIYGHYNYACTLGILIREKAHEWHHLKEKAFEHLESTLAIRPAYVSKMLSDPDLSELRKDFRFYSILGYDINDPEDAVFVLSSLSWYGGATSGIFPYTAGAEFYSDGSFEFWFYTPKWFDSFAAEDLYRVNGSYRCLEGGRLQMDLSGPMLRKRNLEDIYTAPDDLEPRREFSGRLSEEGELSFEIFDYQFYSTYEQFSS